MEQLLSVIWNLWQRLKSWRSFKSSILLAKIQSRLLSSLGNNLCLKTSLRLITRISNLCAVKYLITNPRWSLKSLDCTCSPVFHARWILVPFESDYLCETISSIAWLIFLKFRKTETKSWLDRVKFDFKVPHKRMDTLFKLVITLTSSTVLIF